MKKISLFTCLLALGLFIFSCSDEDEIAPVITITAPTNTTTASPGESIDWDFSVTDDEGLGSIVVSGTLGLSTTFTTFDTETSHALTATIDIDSLTPLGAATIIMTAEDTSGNTSEETVTITIQ